MAGGVMGLLFLLLGVAIIGGAALLISGRWREGLPEVAQPEDPMAEIPPGSLTAADIESVQLEQAVRGYRMDDVDRLVERLGQEIEVRDAEIARLRAADEPPSP